MPVMLHRRYGIKISQKKCDKLKKQLGLRTLYPHRDTSAVNPKQISMDGKGRWADNIIMERFWRTYKHESFLHRDPRNLEEAIVMTSQWLEYYNKERPHSALGYMSPQQYRDAAATPLAANFWRDFSAPAQLAALRAAPSLRSGRYA